MSVREELRFGFTSAWKQVGQHLVCNYTYLLYVCLYTCILLQLILWGCVLKGLATQIRGAVGDCLPKSCFFQLNPVVRQGMLQEMPI